MSDLYEIFVDGELRVAIYDDVRLAIRLYVVMVRDRVAGDNSTLIEAEEKVVLVYNGSRTGPRLPDMDAINTLTPTEKE